MPQFLPRRRRVPARPSGPLRQHGLGAQPGRSYAPRCETPVVRPNHRRANVGLVSAVTNRGEVCWMVLDGAIKAPILIRFLEHLVRDAGRKVFLILDRLQVHRAGLVRAWLDGRQDQIAVFYLLAYSLDLNPDESLNDDVKQAVTARPLACSKGHIKQTVITHMRYSGRIHGHAGAVSIGSAFESRCLPTTSAVAIPGPPRPCP
nr:transposase [Dankookia rubra]